MSDFFTKKNCDRCYGDLKTRTMSWLNEDVICMDCSKEERNHERYKEAKEAELAEVKKGNLNYKGLLSK